MKITVNKGEAKKPIQEIVINEMTVQDIINASRVASAAEGPAFMAALISQICTFDGKTLTYEEITELSASTFLELSAALAISGVLPSEGLLSSLSETGTSATKA